MAITQIGMNTTTSTQPTQQQDNDDEVHVETNLSSFVWQLQEQLFEMRRQHAQEISTLRQENVEL